LHSVIGALRITVTVYSIPNSRLRAAPFGTRVAADDGGEMVKERRRAKRGADRFGGSQRRQRRGRRLRLDEIGEAAGAAVEERRDGHEVVVAPG
jgi:hypothetical protein